MRSSPSSVAPILTSKRSEPSPSRLARLVGASAVGLCVACGSSSFETATELPKTPRRVPGVVLEPPSTVPPAEYRAPIAAVVTLRERRSDDDIEGVVKAFVRALQSADLLALRALTSEDVFPFDMGRDPVLASKWASRAQRFQEQRAAGVDVADHCIVDPSPDADAPSHDGTQPGDWLVRVAVDTSRAITTSPLRESFVLIFRVEHGGLRIAGETDDR